MPKTENRAVLLKGLLGLQEVLFALIRALLWILPLGILAFSAQLSAQIEAGIIVSALGKYTLVILGGNLIQFFIVLPIFLAVRGLNPIHVFRKMLRPLPSPCSPRALPAPSPVTLASAEQRLNVHPQVSRFVLPICTTINMNGCAASSWSRPCSSCKTVVRN